jgi:hypothetical protein
MEESVKIRVGEENVGRRHGQDRRRAGERQQTPNNVKEVGVPTTYHSKHRGGWY